MHSYMCVRSSSVSIDHTMFVYSYSTGWAVDPSILAQLAKIASGFRGFSGILPQRRGVPNLGKVELNDRTLFSRTLESCLIREIIPKWPHKFRLVIVKYDNLPRLMILFVCTFAFFGIHVACWFAKVFATSGSHLGEVKGMTRLWHSYSYRLSPNQR